MGARWTEVQVKPFDRESMRGSFRRAVDEAAHMRGHGGYSGSLAEKSNVQRVYRCEGEAPADTIARLFGDESHWVQDKFSPAAAVWDESGGVWWFFGWCSS